MNEIVTTSGRVRGEGRDEVVAYRGIPFARAPFGENRFRPPQPPPRWDGVRDTVTFGPGCPQPSLDPTPERTLYFNPTVTGADCLNLNVWTPDPGAAGLPVMVWIHGGGYISGAGSAIAHDGATWARDGVVYVSVNYRLHLEGFLYLGDETANLGLQDQVAALTWVQENIAAFGGDPANVTVFGQSAGGVSVMHLLAMPSARGLFRRAIAQSGSTLPGAEIELAERVTRRMAELFNVAPTRAAFRDLPTDRVLAAVTTIAFEYISPAIWGADAFLISPFRPVIDGQLLPAAVETAVRAGAARDIDFMAGWTRDETTFAMQPLGLLSNPPAAWAEAALDAFGLTADDVDASDAGALQEAWTDWAFRRPTQRLLDLHAGHPAGTFAYEFAWSSPAFPELGATHALELPFVNDGLAAYRDGVFPADNQLGPEPPQQLADRMHRAWVDYATCGDPGWKAYESGAGAVMRFDDVSCLMPTRV